MLFITLERLLKTGLGSWTRIPTFTLRSLHVLQPLLDLLKVLLLVWRLSVESVTASVDIFDVKLKWKRKGFLCRISIHDLRHG